MQSHVRSRRDRSPIVRYAALPRPTAFRRSDGLLLQTQSPLATQISTHRRQVAARILVALPPPCCALNIEKTSGQESNLESVFVMGRHLSDVTLLARPERLRRQSCRYRWLPIVLLRGPRSALTEVTPADRSGSARHSPQFPSAPTRPSTIGRSHGTAGCTSDFFRSASLRCSRIFAATLA